MDYNKESSTHNIPLAKRYLLGSNRQFFVNGDAITILLEDFARDNWKLSATGP